MHPLVIWEIIRIPLPPGLPIHGVKDKERTDLHRLSLIPLLSLYSPHTPPTEHASKVFVQIVEAAILPALARSGCLALCCLRVLDYLLHCLHVLHCLHSVRSTGLVSMIDDLLSAIGLRASRCGSKLLL